VVGFIAGMQTERGKVYGHAGAVWHDDWESAGSKKRCWEKAGFVMADTLGDVGGLLKREAMRLGLA
jgi:succinyl-CoA synthetase alpha subunit